MKIRSKNKSYETVMSLPKGKEYKPKKPDVFFRTLLRVVSLPDLLAVRFRAKYIDMDKLGKKEPCLVLMNHSSFIDLEIAASALYPRPLNIICTTDAFVGKNWLMRQLGCIPTRKFCSDPALVRNMQYALHTLGSSVLMFPEAGYTFDGTSTTLPDYLGQCIKMLGVPVVMIRTYGAFARDPLYNNLQKRRVRVSADVRYLLSPDEIAEKSAEELNGIVSEQFVFDNFRWQQENRVAVKAPFRADFLNRVLYKCPHCLTEGKMEGKGTSLTCRQCGKVWELDEFGSLHTAEGEVYFSHIPDWFAWERECVRQEIEAGTYRLDVPVKISMLVDSKCLYHVGEGRLVHSEEGFVLTGCDGTLEYRQKPTSSYSLNADYYWYELGDVISIGDHRGLYYCFPQTEGDIVAKTRLATEEIWKIARAKMRARRENRK
ncbi:MAG: hypothetical protein E7658_05670 [Ruminococcaceae bacterium]|nr:hypothetical protein [Oscillospiraceae bacterium]